MKCDKIRARPDTAGLITALEERDIIGASRRMYNVFEDIVPHGKISSIADIKSEMLDHGALGAIMTGTGSAVFGLFDEKNKATGAFERLRKEYKECYLTETVGATIC